MDSQAEMAHKVPRVIQVPKDILELMDSQEPTEEMAHQAHKVHKEKRV